MTVEANLGELFEAYLEKENKRLSELEPQGLYAPICYALECGGKRIRPHLTLLSSYMWGGDSNSALDSAFALEVFHNFTLLHDDIMDNAILRRGRDVVHKKFGENSAILSGDAMSILAYHYLAKGDISTIAEKLTLFNETALEICCGQQYDTEFEERGVVALEEYLEMIRLKTAVLLACSLKMGAISAGTSVEVSNRMYQLGIHLGLAFQLQDDYLDSFGDTELFGKEIGGDIVMNKKTVLLISAQQKLVGDDLESLNMLISQTGGNREEKVSAVLELYRKAGVDGLVQEMIEAECAKGLAILASFNLDEKLTAPLESMISAIRHRSS